MLIGYRLSWWLLPKMASIKDQLKKIITGYPGPINPSYLANQLKLNKKTVRTYLNQLKDELGLIKQQKGKYVFYTFKQPLNNLQEPPSNPLLVAHDLHILLPLTHVRQEGCLNKLFKYETQEEKLGALLAYCFNGTANIYKFKPKFRKGEKTTIDGKFWSKEGKRSIYFKLSWGNECIKNNGCPSLYLIVGCTQSPLDSDGFKWLEHHISTSFNMDLNDGIVKQHAIGIDIEGEGSIRTNRDNIAYHLFKDYYIEAYDKEFEDGETKLRVAAHWDKDLRYHQVSNMVHNLGNTDVLAERLLAMTDVLNEHSRLIGKLCTNVTLMTKSFNQVIIQNNVKEETYDSKEYYR